MFVITADQIEGTWNVGHFAPRGSDARPTFHVIYSYPFTTEGKVDATRMCHYLNGGCVSRPLAGVGGKPTKKKR